MTINSMKKLSYFFLLFFLISCADNPHREERKESYGSNTFRLYDPTFSINLQKKRGSVAARLRGEAEKYCNKSNKRARLIMINVGVNYNEEYKCE